jgi:signal transduction histidine kinase
MYQSTSGRHRRSASAASLALPQFPPRPAKTGTSWRLRPRTVRAKIVTLLAVPVIALMALWGLAAVTAVRSAYAEQQVTASEKPVRATMADAQAALSRERAAAVRLLTQQSPQAGSFTAAASATDTAVTAVRAGTASAAVPIDALGPELRARIHTALAAFDTLPALRRRVAGHGIATADVYDAYTAAIDDAGGVGDALAQARAAARPSSGTEAAAVLGLLAVLVSLPVSVRVGRGLVVELVGLRDDALDLAGRRLPAAISRLRAGGTVDLEQIAPLPAAGTREATGTERSGQTDPADQTGGQTGQTLGSRFGDEVGQVAEALAVVQRAALEAAVERAEMVSGVARIFLNLARRSQILVHRQLALLDAMERRVADPAEIEDLFRLDHLATRMRRHAESLIILSGQAPGRGWRRPVPLLDVLRSAVAEVEDFARVDVHRVPADQVTGGAVADLTHLVAELVENATLFSPPDARVAVRAVRAGHECVVEVEDTGLGMGPEALAEANARLADARQTDMFDSDRLGLFVVSRLARRHGVNVLLRVSEHGGTVAQVRVPVSVLEEPDAREPARPIDEAPLTSVADSGGGRRMDGIRAERRQTPVPVGENGLPRRIRQTSLAPQLRGHQVPTTANGHDGSDDRPGAQPRSPDEVRATMAALQNGWTLGRASTTEREWDDGHDRHDGDNRDDRRGSG